jgi:mxaJ protein
MCLRSPEASWSLRLALVVALAGIVGGCDHARAATTMRDLRVCADPNNLPFSNQREEGFENRIAKLVARDLNAKLTYVWSAQRRGFTRNTLNAHKCDLFVGIPSSFERVSATVPYYRSSYVFVTRRDRGIELASFDDPQLRKLQIGVQLIGDDGINTPPAHALTKRHMVQNVHGFSVYGDYRTPNPPARIIDAVANGDIDVAVAWGPLAGYFAQRERVPLDIRPVSPQIDLPFLPFVFDISMGVRRENSGLRDQLNQIITRRRKEIDAILEEFKVPRVDLAPTEAAS